MVTAGRAVVSILVLAWVLGRVEHASAYSPPEVYVPGIIETWESRAPNERDEVGFALSVAFVNWPSVFLRCMHERRDTFRTWLESVERHTFRRKAEPGRGVWVVKEMRRLAGRWDGVRYHDMTDAIGQTAGRLLANSTTGERP
jgi:hypothetical protein